MAADVVFRVGGIDEGAAAVFHSVTAAVKAAAAAAASLAAGLVYAASEAAKEATTFARLRQSVEQTGEAWGEAEGKLNRLFERIQKTTRYEDDEAAGALDQLIRMTGDYAGSVENLSLVFDVAEGSGRGVGTAMMVVAKAMTGNIEAMARVLPEARNLADALGKDATEAQKTEAAMGLLQSRYGSAAQALDPLTLAQSVLRKEFSDTVVAVGDLVNDSGFLVVVYNEIVKVFDAAQAALENNRGAFRAIGQVIKDVARPALMLFVDGLFILAATGGRAFALFVEVLNTAVEPVRRISELLYQLDVIEEPLKFAGLDDAVLGFDVLATAIDDMKRSYDEAVAAGAIGAGVEFSASNRGSGRPQPATRRPPANVAEPHGGGKPGRESMSGLDPLGDFAVVGALSGIREFVEEDLQELVILQNEAAFAMAEANIEAAEASREAWKQTFADSIVAAGVSAFKALGAAFGRFIATGKFGAKQFGLAMLGAVGDMAVAMGTFIITTSLALQALQSFAPAASLALGIALVAFGAVLSGVVSGAMRGGGRGRASAPTTTPDFGSLGPQTRDDPREMVLNFHVNTSGSSDDGTAGFIARMLARAKETGDLDVWMGAPALAGVRR